MTTNNNAGEVITLAEAVQFTHNYQEKYPHETKAFLVDVDKIKLITEQENCTGIRIYNGYDTENNKTNLVLVGVNEQGQDMTKGIILEGLKPCPPYCSSSSLIK